MKLNYILIEKNISIYEDAKSKFPVISQWEKSEVSTHVMNQLGLNDFMAFSNLRAGIKLKGQELIMPNMTWFKLKPILVSLTKSPRLAKLISNKTQPEFKRILMDEEVFDRLLNGRWVSKPKQGKRRMTYGRRADECVDGLNLAIIPLINYIIQNDIEVYDKIRFQSIIVSQFSWFTSKELSFENVPNREISVTNKLLDSFINVINESKIDFRKLNVDYITSSISQ